MMRRLLLLFFVLASYQAFSQCSLDLGQDTVYFCDGDCASLDAGSGWSSISWSTGETSASICPDGTGWYFANVLDNLGCSALDSVYAIRLLFDVEASDTSVCPGQLIQLSASLYGEISTSATVGDTITLADGSTTSIVIPVNEFPIGSTYDSSQLQIELCTALEHSFLGDLEMTLTCPNGTWVNIFNSYDGNSSAPGIIPGGFNGGGTNLGNPQDDETWDYCFRNYATNETMGEALDNDYTSPTTGALLPGYFLPEESFNGFDGCPMNGDWTLTIADNWPADNGTLTFAGLNISPTVSPVTYSWSSGVDSSSYSQSINTESIWVDMTIDGVTCSDTMEFSFYTVPTIELGIDNADCDQSNGQIINTTNPLDSILMSIFDSFGIPVNNSLLDPGLYEVTFTSPEGCSLDTVIEVTTHFDSVQNITGATVVFPGQQFTYSVPDNACLTYSWTIDNGTIVSGQGTHEVQVTWNDSISGWIAVDMNETRDFGQSLILYVGTATSVSETETEPELLRFYNQSLTVLHNEPARLLLMDASGKLVLDKPVQPAEVVKCSNLTNGVYVAVLVTEEEKSTLKFSVTR